MREEEKRKKGKTERAFSNGIIVLVFLTLAAQSAFFARHVIQDLKDSPKTSHAKADSSMAAITAGFSGSDVKGDTASASGQYDTATAPASRAPAAKQPAGPAKESAAASGTRTPEVKQRPYDGWKWDTVELNSADSAALDALPGIGPYFARQILLYRERLGFYADISQLMDIRGVDTSMLSRLEGRIYIDPASIRHIDFYTMSEDSMAAHPYIGPYAAKGLDRLRRTVPRSQFTISKIIENKILSPAQASRLKLYMEPELPVMHNVSQ